MVTLEIMSLVSALTMPVWFDFAGLILQVTVTTDPTKGANAQAATWGAPYAYDRPFLISLNPNNSPALGGINVTITGVVRIRCHAVTCTSAPHTWDRCILQ